MITMEEYVRQVNTNIELSQEIERLNTDKEQLNSLVNFNQKEIRRLHSIIKEVRDLVNKEEFTMKQKYEMREELLEILDKV